LSNAIRKSRVEFIYVGIGFASIFVSKNEINPIVYNAENLCTDIDGIGEYTFATRTAKSGLPDSSH